MRNFPTKLFFTALVIADLLIPVMISAAPDSALQIGTVKEISGTVTAYLPSTKTARSLQADDVVFLGETLTTGQNSLINIEFSDRTLFRLGADSEIVLDQYVYDPSSQTGEMSAKVTKGVFRLVTGLIAKQNPENVEVEFPTGSMGIRGTDALGKVGKNEIVVVLYLSEAGTASHAIVAKNAVDGKIFEVEIGTPGMASIIKKGKAPTKPFVASEELLSGMEASLGLMNPYRKSAAVQTPPQTPEEKKKSDKEKEEPVQFEREFV